MKLNKRKGFTIVELVIVIAVIAILAAVLIPNISNLVKKANASADESLVRNLNTALSMDVEKHQTMDAALEAAKINGGYDLTTIVTKNKDNKILWDSKNDCFVYMKKNASKPTYLPNTQEDKTVTDVDYFEIVELKDGKVPDSKYSAYLAGESVLGTVEVERGLDVGKNTVAEVVFKTTDTVSVLINTNGGKLTVDAGSANVTHRGDASIVTIKAVYDKSYHENGKVNEIKLEKGRVVVEAKAEVGSILVTAESATGVKIDVMDSATLGAIGAEKFDISTESGVITGADKTQVVAGATGEAVFAGGFGTEKAPYLIATAEQFKKIHTFNDKMFAGQAFYFCLIDNVDLTDYTGNTSFYGDYFCGELDGNGYSLTLGSTTSREQIIFSESIGNVTIKNLTILQNRYIGCLFYVNNASGWRQTYTTQRGTVVYKNIQIDNVDGVEYSIIPDNNDGTLVGQVSGRVLFEDITVKANFSSGTKYAGLILGGFIADSTQARISFINCVNYGSFEGKDVGFLTGNSNNGNSMKLTLNKDFSDASYGAYVYVDGCKNLGVLKGSDTAGVFSEFGKNKFTTALNKDLSTTAFVNTGYIFVANANVDLTLKEGKIFLASAVDGASYYVLTIQASTKSGALGTYYVRIENNTISTTNGLKKLDKMIGAKEYKAKYGKDIINFELTDALGFGYTVVEENGLTIAVFNNTESVFDLSEVSPKYIIGAYNESGKLIGSNTFSFN